MSVNSCVLNVEQGHFSLEVTVGLTGESVKNVVNPSSDPDFIFFLTISRSAL